MSRIRVIQFLRHSIPGAYSMERVFAGVRTELQGDREIEIETVEVPYSGGSPVTVLLNMWFARRKRADVYHITGDIHYLAMATRKPVILTIHDASSLFFTRSRIKRIFLKWFWFSGPVKRATLVTTVSTKTRREVLQVTGTRPKKVQVVPDYYFPTFVSEPYIFNVKRPAILHVGSTPNKNLARVAMALKGLPCTLEILGKPDQKAMKALRDSGVKYKVHQDLSARAVVKLYASIDLLVFASTYEGFGLPVLEAQATGRPVVASRIDPITEVAGRGACFVDPEDEADIRAAVERIIADKPYRDHLIAEGFENIRRYERARVASMYAERYRTLARLAHIKAS